MSFSRSSFKSADSADESGGFSVHDYVRSVEQTGDTSFVIRHRTDETKNLNITMVVDEDGKYIEWDNLPKSLELEISKDYEQVKAYPVACLNMVLALNTIV